MLATISLLQNAALFALALRRAWKSIPCMTSTILFSFLALGHGILLLGDIDALTNRLFLYLAQPTTIRAVMARTIFILGYLTAEYIDWLKTQKGIFCQEGRR